MTERRVMAWCTVSIDGYSSGPGGPEHDTWLYEHVMRPATGEFLAVVPVLLGGGLRLLPDGVSVDWDLVSSTTLPDGAVGLHEQRADQ
jgi:hypothetical protein